MNMLRAGELPDIYIKDILEAGNIVRPQGKVRGWEGRREGGGFDKYWSVLVFFFHQGIEVPWVSMKETLRIYGQ